MRGKEVNAPELEQNNALDRTKRSKLQKGLPGRRLVEPGRSVRHALKCRICNHPDRAAIEFDFLNWRNPFDLVKGYRFRGLSTIYRHAHATGLFAKRRLNLRFAMERIVERVSEVPVTASSVIRAARAIARINDEGQWVDPPSRLIVTHVDAEETPQRQRRKPTRTGVTAKPRPTPIFDPVLLDEPSESAAGELPKIDGNPAAPEVILTLTPEFQRCRDERNRAIEADRRAKEEVPSAPSSPSSLPQAAVLNSAPPALTSSGSCDAITARAEELVASPSSTLPPARRGGEAAPDKPATACPEQGAPSASRSPLRDRGAKQSPRAAGPPLGSSGSADPPFPFVPRVPLRHHARRHFLIENEMRSRGESND